MRDCLFCKIVKGEISCQKIYEDETVLAFLDINPINLGHTLVVPKEHCENLLDVKEDVLQKLASAIPKIAKAIMTAFDYPAFNLGVNNGSVAGQLIPHLHFHIMPRREGDGHRLFAGKPAIAEELAQIGERLRVALRNSKF